MIQMTPQRFPKKEVELVQIIGVHCVVRVEMQEADDNRCKLQMFSQTSMCGAENQTFPLLMIERTEPCLNPTLPGTLSWRK